jgi:hypothetical protein
LANDTNGERGGDMSGFDHLDVASYALGVLDAQGVADFEEHLITCDRCAAELESMLPVARLLAEVDRDTYFKTERSMRDGQMYDRMRNVVALERRRTRYRTVGLSAVAAVLAIVAAISIAIGLATRANIKNIDAGKQPGTSAPSSPSSTPSPTPTELQPGIGGPPPGTQHSTTDKTTGANLDVWIDGRPFGSQVSVQLANVRGPLNCTLVAVSKDGVIETTAAWTVSPEGYGTPAHPEPLLLTGSSSMPPDKLAKLEVRAVNPQGITSILVAITL